MTALIQQIAAVLDETENQFIFALVVFMHIWIIMATLIWLALVVSPPVICATLNQK